LAGLPSVDLSACCGTPPPIVVMTSRIARPIVAFARKPGPNRFPRALMSSSRAIGPFTIRTGLAGFVVPCTPYRLNGLARIAVTAVTTTGKYSGLHPAMTALTAILVIVASPQRGAIGPSDVPASRSVEASISATRAAVGGTIGSPSVQPSRVNNSKIASGSSATVIRSTTAATASVRGPASVSRPAIARPAIAAIACSARPSISTLGTLTIGCWM